MKLPELQSLAKEHNIKGCSYRNKSELMTLLGEKGLLSSEFVEKENLYREEREEKKKRKAEGSNLERLKTIRTNPRRVEILNRETGEVVVYPSMYKASKAFGQCARVISKQIGKVWKNRYEIKALDDDVNKEQLQTKSFSGNI